MRAVVSWGRPVHWYLLGGMTCAAVWWLPTICAMAHVAIEEVLQLDTYNMYCKMKAKGLRQW